MNVKLKANSCFYAIHIWIIQWRTQLRGSFVITRCLSFYRLWESWGCLHSELPLGWGCSGGQDSGTAARQPLMRRDAAGRRGWGWTGWAVGSAPGELALDCRVTFCYGSEGNMLVERRIDGIWAGSHASVQSDFNAQKCSDCVYESLLFLNMGVWKSTGKVWRFIICVKGVSLTFLIDCG